jgi:hypothetical protein
LQRAWRRCAVGGSAQVFEQAWQERTNKMTLELKPEPAWSGFQVIARGYSCDGGDVIVTFLFREQSYQVQTCAGLLRYPFRSRRAAVSFAAELCDEEG